MTISSVLSSQEKKWILEKRLTRITDNEEVLIYPMGAERYLSTILFEEHPERYNIRSDIQGKHILVIPGYGNSAFLFAQAGAKSITVYDKDPVTIAWIKSFKHYYHYRENKLYPSIAELLTALTCWYPPLLNLPSGRVKNFLSWIINPQFLRRTYIHYMLFLVKNAIQSNIQNEFALDKDIQFYAGELSYLKKKDLHYFETAYVPYLLGVKNGIEHENNIVSFIKELIQLVPKGRILVTPIQNTKEFNYLGSRYFETTQYANIQAIPKLQPYIITEDKNWFKNQGLAVFGANSQTSIENVCRDKDDKKGG